MNTTAKAHEPTMEEILASIRRIISDDEPAPSAKGATPLKPAETMKPVEPTQDSLGQDDIDAMLASFDEPEPTPAIKPQPAAKLAPVAPSALERPDASPRAAAFAPAMTTPHVAPKMVLGEDIDVFELTDEMATDASEPASSSALSPVAVSSRLAPERLISAATDEAVGAAFGSLAHTMMSNNGRTIDDLVKELLKPMLKSWLDDNLPPLVERLVRQEIERVARGGH